MSKDGEKRSSMRALRFTEAAIDSSRTEVADVEPPTPEAGEISIDVAFAGINFADVMARRGDAGYVLAWPWIPGLEVAGTVREVGAGVTGFARGQRVAALTSGGGFAGISVSNAALVVGVPEVVDLSIAAAAPIAATSAWLMLNDVARVRSGESVLMHAASGGVGRAVAQLAPILGARRLVGTVGKASKADAARAAGWGTVIVRSPFLAADVLADGGPVDVILDASGTELLDIDLEVAAPGARIVHFGNAGGGSAQPMPEFSRLRRGNVAIAGFSITSLAATAPARVARAMREVFDHIAGGRLALDVVTVASLAEVGAVHDLMAGGNSVAKYVAVVS